MSPTIRSQVDWKPTPWRPRLVVLVFNGLLTLFASAGCGGPCESLAEKICECKPNTTEESACRELIRAVGERPVSPEEEDQCSALLDTCTCNALEIGDLAACGLSKMTGAP